MDARGVAMSPCVRVKRLGLAILKRAWFNLDLLWVIALMISGILILVL